MSAKKSGKRGMKSRKNGNKSGVGEVPQRNLIPGSPEWLQARKAQYEAEKASTREQEDERIRAESVQSPTDEDAGPEAQVGEAYAQSREGIRNYRNFMKKYEQLDETRAIIEEGLGRPVSAEDLDDELHDPQVSAADFKHAAVEDHAAEFESKREVPVVDTNNDGKVDAEDEVIMTPGMRRMARYM